VGGFDEAKDGAEGTVKNQSKPGFWKDQGWKLKKALFLPSETFHKTEVI
jgi:hypothetical protein